MNIYVFIPFLCVARALLGVRLLSTARRAGKQDKPEEGRGEGGREGGNMRRTSSKKLHRTVHFVKIASTFKECISVVFFRFLLTIMYRDIIPVPKRIVYICMYAFMTHTYHT